MPAVAMYHERNPREVLLERVGDISDIEVFSHDVLVAIYERPEKTKGGIMLTQTTRKEDLYQGKTALVLKCGPTAFQDMEGVLWPEGVKPIEPGDWVFFRAADGWACTLINNAVPARIIKDALIRGRLADPDLVY